MAAIAQGVGCSSDDSTTTPPPADAGKDSTSTTDAGQSTCSGAVPELSVQAGDGTPDLSCYEADAAVLAPIIPTLDDGGDAADDAPDGAAADASDDAPDAEAPDAGGDATTGDDGGSDGGADAGPTRTFPLQVLEFVTTAPTDGIQVQAFTGPSALGAPFFTGTTADGGLVDLVVPEGMAVPSTVTFVSSATGYSKTNLYDQVLLKPPTRTIDFTISTQNTSRLVASVLGSEPLSSTKTLLVAAARDCQGRDLRGAILELVDDATGQAITTDKSPGGARVVYFDETGIPSASCTFTSNASQSIWSVINAPVNVDATAQKLTHSYSVRMSGRRKGEASPVVLNKVPVELWLGAGNVARAYKQSPPK